jgi:hypothetical protein
LNKSASRIKGTYLIVGGGREGVTGWQAYTHTQPRVMKYDPNPLIWTLYISTGRGVFRGRTKNSSLMYKMTLSLTAFQKIIVINYYLLPPFLGGSA